MSQYLIKTVDELKAHVSFAYTEDGFDKVKPFILNAQETYLKPLLCADLYNQLLNYADPESSVSGSASASASASSSAVDTTVADAWLGNLLTQARRALAFLTLYEGFPVLEVQFGSDGVHRIEGDELKSIHSGQRARLEQSLMKHGFNLLESMVEYMEDNAPKFHAWTESTCYTKHKGRVIRSAKEYTEIWGRINNKRITYRALLSYMREVEEDVLKELLGADLHTAWFDERKADNLSEANTALLDMMQRIVAYGAAAEAMPELAIAFESYGLFTPLITGNERNVQELSKADAARFNEMRQQLRDKCAKFKNKLRDYLNDNASTYTDFDYDSTNTVNTGSLDDQDEKGMVMF
jgi:hypothetical protein